ncbi:MAG: DUF2225 domain-containing protein [Spirochaetales bacterium]|nr:DUF2225 domain-containing protein [Spirochaetales bacterium]
MAEARITFRGKKDLTCPVCRNRFRKEELLTGGGRMNAGDLTDELHRVYLPTQKYGEVRPLLYPVTVCPQCWYAAYPRNFDTLDGEARDALDRDIGTRKSMLRPIFPELDFDRDRGLAEGCASYVLAALCYEHRPLSDTPTFFRALSFLRAGWLAADLHKAMPSDNYDYLSAILLRKASFFYGEILECERRGLERIEEIPSHGPDLDNNYGFDGVLYLVGVLLLKYGQRDDPMRRMNALKEARAAVSRIVGMGQSSRSKPSVLLDRSRELHKTIKQELELLDPHA